MGKKVDIAALGELLIDFTETGRSENGMKIFEQNPGGAPANLLTVASHMGYRTEFIGKVGKDMHGDFLKATLQKEGIGVSNLLQDEKYFTTLAFVEIAADGERKFSFARKPGADTQIREKEIQEDILSECRIFHFGSLSLTDDPAEDATLKAIVLAKRDGAVISYDPNYRQPLWENEEKAIGVMKSVIRYADLMKVSDEESLLLTGAANYEEAIEKLLKMGPKLVALTIGGDGVLVGTREGKRKIPAFKVRAIDTTGAGDSFWGGFLSAYLSKEKKIEELTWKEIEECALVGNAAAALCVQKRGGIPAIPKKCEIEAKMKER